MVDGGDLMIGGCVSVWVCECVGVGVGVCFVRRVI